jgi:hypothetical protein
VTKINYSSSRIPLTACEKCAQSINAWSMLLVVHGFCYQVGNSLRRERYSRRPNEAQPNVCERGGNEGQSIDLDEKPLSSTGLYLPLEPPSRLQWVDAVEKVGTFDWSAHLGRLD